MLPEEHEEAGRALSALANSARGGWLLLGVGEEVSGVADEAAARACAVQVCDQLAPPLDPRIEWFEVDGRRVLGLEVAPVSRTSGVWFCPPGRPRQRWIRVGDESREWPWDGAEAARAAEAWPRPAEPPEAEPHERAATRWGLEDVSARALQDLFGEPVELKEVHDLLCELGLVRGADLTAAGVEVLCGDVRRENALLVFEGTEARPNHFACTPSELRSAARELTEETQLPEDVLLELLVNAVVHRSYAPGLQGPIRAEGRVGFLRIESPGGAPSPRLMSPNEPGSFQRNPQLARAYAEAGLGEGRGGGLAVVRRELQARRWSISVECTGEQVVVTAAQVSEGAPVPAEPLAVDRQPLPHPFGEGGRHQAVLAVVSPGRRMRSNEVAEALGWPPSTTKRVVRELVDRGKLVFTEPHRNSPRQRVMRPLE